MDLIALPKKQQQQQQQQQVALKYLECKTNYELALIKSNEVVELAKINSTILITTEEDRSRTIEGRVLAGTIFTLGVSLAYKTYETTAPVQDFINTVIDSVRHPLVPDWQSLLLNENQWIVGYAASALNQAIRLFLLLGVSIKKTTILLLQTSEGIISLGGSTAALFVVFIFIVFSGIVMKIYISNIFITPISFKINNRNRTQ